MKVSPSLFLWMVLEAESLFCPDDWWDSGCVRRGVTIVSGCGSYLSVLAVVEGVDVW